MTATKYRSIILLTQLRIFPTHCFFFFETGVQSVSFKHTYSNQTVNVDTSVTTKEVSHRIEKQISTQSLQIVSSVYIVDTQRKIRSNCSNTKTAMGDFNLIDMLRTVAQHIQYNVGEVFCIPHRIWQVIKVGNTQKMLVYKQTYKIKVWWNTMEFISKIKL